MKKAVLKFKAIGLTKEEKKYLLQVVRKINRKRRQSNMPRLLYKIKFN